MGVKMDDIKIGNKYSYWTVIGLEDGLPEHHYKALCRCICGTIRWISHSRLRHGKAKSCGCKNHKPVNYGIHPGDKIGYWTILRQDHDHFLCRCVCGKEKRISAATLLQGRSRSCGCHRQDHRDFSRPLERGREISQAIFKDKLAVRYAGFGRKSNKNSSTGITGVSRWRNGMYRAYITLDRKQIGLGCFDTLEEATQARKTAEQKYFAERQLKVDKIRQEYQHQRKDQPSKK